MTDIKRLDVASDTQQNGHNNEQPQMGREPWRELIGEGWIWTARARKVQWIGGVALFGLVVSITYDMTSNIFAAARPMQSEPVSMADRFLHEPLTTLVNEVRGWFPSGDAVAAYQRPRYERHTVFVVTRESVQVKDTGTFRDYHDYIVAQMTELNESGELAYECTPFAKLTELEYTLDGKTVYCKEGADAWYFTTAAIHDSGWRPELSANFGVIKNHGDSGGWQFHNVKDVISGSERFVLEGDTGSDASRAKPLGGVVNPEMIVDTMSRDFPELFDFGAKEGGAQ